jgi:hypothetical protein
MPGLHAESNLQSEAHRAAEIWLPRKGLMAAALPAFQLASNLGPSPSREQELEERCARQAEENERLREMLEGAEAPQACIHPNEKQAFLQVLSDLAKRVEHLEKLAAREAAENEDLRKKNKELDGEIYEVRQMARTIIQDACKRITAIEEKSKPENSETNQIRAKKIKEYLAENGTPGKFLDKRTRKLVEGRAVRFELLRSYLEIDKWQLNRALRALLKMYPGEYCKKKLNKTTWILVERPKL